MRKVKLLLAVAFAALTIVACSKKDTENEKGFEASNGTDLNFAHNSNFTNELEMSLAQLASTRATDTMVRNYAQQMLQFSRQLRNPLQRAAESARLATAIRDSSQIRLARTYLGQRVGRRFDSMYIRDRAAAFTQMLALYQGQINSGISPSLKGFASATLPALQQLRVRVDSIARRF